MDHIILARLHDINTDAYAHTHTHTHKCMNLNHNIRKEINTVDY